MLMKTGRASDSCRPMAWHAPPPTRARAETSAGRRRQASRRQRLRGRRGAYRGFSSCAAGSGGAASPGRTGGARARQRTPCHEGAAAQRPAPSANVALHPGPRAVRALPPLALTVAWPWGLVSRRQGLLGPVARAACRSASASLRLMIGYANYADTPALTVGTQAVPVRSDTGSEGSGRAAVGAARAGRVAGGGVPSSRVAQRLRHGRLPSPANLTCRMRACHSFRVFGLVYQNSGDLGLTDRVQKK